MLCCALLCCGVLRCYVLSCAVLCFAVLFCAVLCCGVLCCAVLCHAVLCCAVLCCAVLSFAVMCCAVLCCRVVQKHELRQPVPFLSNIGEIIKEYMNALAESAVVWESNSMSGYYNRLPLWPFSIAFNYLIQGLRPR